MQHTRASRASATADRDAAHARESRERHCRQPSQALQASRVCSTRRRKSQLPGRAESKSIAVKIMTSKICSPQLPPRPHAGPHAALYYIEPSQASESFIISHKDRKAHFQNDINHKDHVQLLLILTLHLPDNWQSRLHCFRSFDNLRLAGGAQ